MENAQLWASWVRELLVSQPEQDCEELTRLASSICGTSLGLVTLLDERQQWFRASESLKLGDTPREIAFCAHAIRQEEVFVVKDSLLDNRFGANPLVIADPPIRFYAGVVLTTSDGYILGTFSVVDTTPRILSAEQTQAFEVLARQVSARLELRMQRRVLNQALLEKERATSALRASEELFRAFMNASPFLSYIKDAAGRLLFYNRAFAQRFGVSEQAWLGRTDEQLWSRNLTKSVRTHDLEVMAGGRMVETEEHIRAADGTLSSLRSFKFPCSDSAGNVLLAGVAVDISAEVAHKSELERYHRELEEANEQLRRLAVTDELTGLRNRRAFEERLVMEFSMARRRRRELAVLLIDVDNFKMTNDRYGHAAGDEVLRRLGMILRTTVRLPDLPARYGGEEFVVLLPESGEESAMGLARRVMARVAAEDWDNEAVTISMGMAAINESLNNGYQLVELADEALYAAKRAGKNRVMVHSG
ncbi:MAG: diguanylate cyclase [Edaphobacter sp.]|uniref:GGDEF domain-containing protein n=1 Tax=Edaphobacter sp. TaxID=1934404 RepID=UPI002394A635|nr:diguanylate cyclase [Edaphobacter sp.]MDE1175656.1 diguanylate cyclase [Edaphobacter sp.]